MTLLSIVCVCVWSLSSIVYVCVWSLSSRCRFSAPEIPWSHYFPNIKEKLQFFWKQSCMFAIIHPTSVKNLNANTLRLNYTKRQMYKSEHKFWVSTLCVSHYINNFAFGLCTVITYIIAKMHDFLSYLSLSYLKETIRSTFCPPLRPTPSLFVFFSAHPHHTAIMREIYGKEFPRLDHSK